MIVALVVAAPFLGPALYFVLTEGARAQGYREGLERGIELGRREERHDAVQHQAVLAEVETARFTEDAYRTLGL